MPATKSSKFQIGDKVRVDTDLESVRNVVRRVVHLSFFRSGQNQVLVQREGKNRGLAIYFDEDRMEMILST